MKSSTVDSFMSLSLDCDSECPGCMIGTDAVTETVVQSAAATELLLASSETESESESENEPEYDPVTHRRILTRRGNPDQDQDYDSVDDDEDIPPANPSTSRSSSSSSRTTSSSNWTRGRGKGGHRLGIVNNQLRKEKYTREELKQRKKNWKTFMTGFKAEIDMVLSSKQSETHFDCPTCDKTVTRSGLMRHRTLQGCKNM